MTDLEVFPGDRAARYPGFVCFKTFQAIRYNRRWFRLALVTAALDRSVTRMGPCPVPVDRLPAGTEFAFWTQTKEFSQILLVSTEAVDDNGMRSVVQTRNLTRHELAQLPSTNFAKAIWAEKRTTIGQLEHYAFARISREHSTGIRLESLVKLAWREVGGDIELRFRSAYSLIANGYLETDIGRGLRPDTMVYPGPLLAEDWGRSPTLADRNEGQLELFASSRN